MSIEQELHYPMIAEHYLFNAQENTFRHQVKEFFNKHSTLFAEQNKNEREPDPRNFYQLLGKEKLLAPHWPEIYGGQNKTMVEMAILVEEMVNANIPETLFILSIQITGNLIYLLGNKRQKAQWLPSLASGDSFACVLFSEMNAGSDLAALETKAIQKNEEYFEITGKKIYSLKTQFCQYGLCAARTNNNSSKYDGITVFFVPLDAEGVSINTVPSMADEPFHEIVFNKVNVSKDNIIGKINEGWHVISETLMLERTGFDCILKAGVALNIVSRCVKDSSALNIFHIRRDAVRILCYSLLRQYANEQYIPEAKSAMAKWYSSTLAMDILRYGVQHINIKNLILLEEDQLKTKFSAIYRDIPGVTLSSGSSEMMLEIIARTKFEPSDFKLNKNIPDDNLLYEKFRGIFLNKLTDYLHYFTEDNPQKPSSELFALIAPKENGGMDLGLEISALMCEEAGKLTSNHDVAGRLTGLNFSLFTEIGKREKTIQDILSGALALFIFSCEKPFRSTIGFLPEDYTKTNHCQFLLVVADVEHYDIYLIDSMKFEAQKEILFGFDIYRYTLDPTLFAQQKPFIKISKTDFVLEYISSLQNIYYSAYFLGLAQKACELVMSRLTLRMQFDKKIISYQSPRFNLAAMLTDITVTHSYLDYAIWAVGNKESNFNDISEKAFELAKHSVFSILKTALHLHGAYGLTKEAEIQELYRLFILQSSYMNRLLHKKEQ